MKKILNSRLFIFLLGFVLASSITAYALVAYSASQIMYTKSNNQEVTLDTALNELYTSADTTISNLQSQINGYSTFDLAFVLKSSNFEIPLSGLKNSGNYSSFKIVNLWKSSGATCDISKVQNESTWANENSGYVFDTVYTIPSGKRLIVNATNGQCDFRIYLYK